MLDRGKLVAGFLVLGCLGAAAPAEAATWNAPVSLTSAPTGYLVQIAEDPAGGPSLVANNQQDNQLSYTDLTPGSSAAWSNWTQLGPNGGPYAQPWPPNYQLPLADYLPFSFSEGANGDMVAAWVECQSIQGSNAQGCVLKASLRPSGAGWDTPVTVDDGTAAAPGTDSGQYPNPAISLANSNGSVTQVSTVIDGSGNATILWGKYNSSNGEDFVAASLESDGTTVGSVSSLGYTNTPPQMVAAANGDITFVSTAYDNQTASPYLAAISATATQVQTASLPGPQVAFAGSATPVGLTTSSTGKATILVVDASNNNMVTASQDSSGNWQSPLTVAASPVQSGSPTAWLVEDGGGDASVVWVDANNVLQLSDLPASASAWTSPQAISDSSHPYASGGEPAVNSGGDMVVAWGSTDSSNQVVYARVRPAGGSFDAPTQIGPAGASLGPGPVINNSGSATVLYSTTQGMASESTDNVGSGGGGGTLPALGQNPGAPTLTSCQSSAKMPALTGVDQTLAVPKLEDPAGGFGFPFPHVTVIERHPTNPPSSISKDGFGEVYSQTPAAGTAVHPCTSKVRLVVYGGPSGVSAGDYKSLKGLVGQSLTDALNLGSTWHIDWHFQPDPALNNTGKVGKVTKVVEVSLKARQIEVTVAMPTDKNDYQGRIFDGGPLTKIVLPSVGADGDLSMNMRDVFAASAWSAAAPVDAQLIMDTHDVGNNETRGSGFAEDNVIGSTSSTSKTLSSGEQVRYLKDAAVFHVTPLQTGDVYILASWPCGDSTCYAFDDIPVVRRTQPWDSYNGYRYAANGDYCGTVQQHASSCSKPARDVSTAPRRPRAIHAATDTSCAWYDLGCWFQHLFSQDQQPTPGTNPSPGGGTSTNPLNCSPGTVITKLPNGNPVVCGDKASLIATKHVYDFDLGMYPMFYSQATGLEAGHVYRYENGKATDLADGSTHVISAGGGNDQDQIHLQANEVFGVYGIVAAGGGNVIAAGGGNVVAAGGGNAVDLHWPVLNADNYNHLAPGTYQINRPDGPDGQVVATPITHDSNGNVISAGGGNVISAGGGNVISAGGGNIVAAGAGNLANGYYNVISAGGGNIISAGGGNIISAGSGNVLDYNSIMAIMPTVQGASDAALTLNNGETMTGPNNALMFGGTALGSNSLAIASLAHPGEALTAGGTLLNLSTGTNLLKLDAAKIMAAGGGNVISAGGGNIIAAGAGNMASNGVH